jgi:hypothetical protein
VSASSSITTGNRLIRSNRPIASSSAPALPTFSWVSITRAPQRRAISTVASVDPSDTTWTLSLGTRAMMDRRLSSRTRASLCAGMSTATSRVVSG